MVSANRFMSSSISLLRDTIYGSRSRTSTINATSNRPAETYLHLISSEVADGNY